MRTVLLTGHTSGIGLACAQQLLTQGHTVIGIARTKIDTTEQNQDRLHQYTIDLSQTDELVSAVNPLLDEHAIDALICNAGEGQFGSIENFSAAQIESNIVLNLISPLILLRSAIPHLKQHERSDIVFIGSESALRGGRYGSIYSAAKFGLRGAAQSLRHECAGSNCHVGIVQPGMTDTGFFDDLSFEPGSHENNSVNAQDVANATLSMLHAPDSAVIEEIVVNPLHNVVQKKVVQEKTTQKKDAEKKGVQKKGGQIKGSPKHG